MVDIGIWWNPLKNFPKGKFYKVDDFINRALLSCEALSFLLVGLQYGWDRGLSKRTVEDASPYKFGGNLNLGDTPHDSIVV